MPIELMEIIFSAIGVIITGLASWATTILVKWLNTKIKNKELASFSEMVVTIVTNAVKCTYQSYVEGIKGTDQWTKEAQEKALQLALETAKKELTTNAVKYIENQHGDIDNYIKTLIESILYDLKNTNKNNK